jgi:hypothetical protein
MFGHVTENKVSTKHVRTCCPNVRTSAWKTFSVCSLCLMCPDMMQNRNFLELASTGCPDMWGNKTILWVASAGLSGHAWEQELSASCVQTQLLAVWTLIRESGFSATKYSREYFLKCCSFLLDKYFCNIFLVQPFLFLINILQYSSFSDLSFLDKYTSIYISWKSSEWSES